MLFKRSNRSTSGEQDNLDFLFVLGICYGKLNRQEESKKTFDQMLRVGGDSAHMHFLLGKAYLDLYVNEHARTELERAVPSIPTWGLRITISVWFISEWACSMKRSGVRRGNDHYAPGAVEL